MAKGAKRAPKEPTAATAAAPAADAFPRSRAAVAVGLLLLLAFLAGSSPLLRSSSDGRCFFPIRLLFWALFEGAYHSYCALAFLLPARRLARLIPGSAGSMAAADDEAGLTAQEDQKHDTSLVWPPTAKLPAEWLAVARGKQPFFLNHVRGHVRLRQASYRLGAATGTLLQTISMAFLLDGETSLASAFLYKSNFSGFYVA